MSRPDRSIAEPAQCPEDARVSPAPVRPRAWAPVGRRRASSAVVAARTPADVGTGGTPALPGRAIPGLPRAAGLSRTVRSMRAVLPFLLYLALSFLLFEPAWEDPTRRNIGYSGDPQQFMWFLSWTAFALGHHHNPLFSTYLDYPRGVNLMWNAALLWPGAIVAPVTAWLGPVFAYNLLVTLALPLSGWCAYLAIRRWTSRIAAAVGGLLYAFSPLMIAQALIHAPVVLALTPPLVLLLLTDLLAQRRWPVVASGAALGVTAAAQVLTWGELLATTAVMAALGLALAVALWRPWRHIAASIGPVLRGVGAAATVFLLIAAVPLYTQFRGPQRIEGLLHREQGDPFAADLLNVVVPTGVQLLTSPLSAEVSAHFRAILAEENAYMGVPLLVLLTCMAARWWPRLLVRWAALLGAIGLVLSLGDHLEVAGHTTPIPLSWLLIARLPLLRYAMPNRLTMFVFLAAGLLLAFFVDRLRAQTPGRRLAGAVVVALALLPLVPRVPYPANTTPTPPFFSGAGVRRVPVDSVALVAPFSALVDRTYSAPMLWQGVAGLRFRMPEGYAFVPGPSGDAGMRPWPSATQETMLRIQQGRDAPRLTAALRGRIARDLHDWKVGAVIVGPMDHQGEMLRLFRRLLRREPDRVGGVYVWWGIERTLDTDAAHYIYDGAIGRARAQL